MEIKASISEQPFTTYKCIACNKLITSVFGTRMSSVPPTNSKFLYKLEACLPRIFRLERLRSHCMSLCIQNEANLRAIVTQICLNRTQGVVCK